MAILKLRSITICTVLDWSLFGTSYPPNSKGHWWRWKHPSFVMVFHRKHGILWWCVIITQRTSVFYHRMTRCSVHIPNYFWFRKTCFYGGFCRLLCSNIHSCPKSQNLSHKNMFFGTSSGRFGPIWMTSDHLTIWRHPCCSWPRARPCWQESPQLPPKQSTWERLRFQRWFSGGKRNG